jgi:hypothetical protein
MTREQVSSLLAGRRESLLRHRRSNEAKFRMRTIVQDEQFSGSHAQRGYIEMPGRDAEDSFQTL